MWTAVLVMAVAVIFEPVRVGLAVLMLNRPRPLLQLFVFLCGGFAMGVGVGFAVLFVLRATPLASSRFAPGHVQIAVGLTVLLIAATMVVKVRIPNIKLMNSFTTVRGGPGAALGAPPALRRDGLVQRMKNLLEGESLWVAGVSGLGTALPSANYMGAMAVILSAGVAPFTQIQALVLFNVIAFTLVEIPLISYLAAPNKTQAVMSSLHSWLRARPRRDLAAIVAAGGCLMLTIGLLRL